MPTFDVRQLRSRGFGYRAFLSIGPAAINDFVVRTPIGIEYEGMVRDAGVAALYDARIFNIGLAIGLDYLPIPIAMRGFISKNPGLVFCLG